MRGRRIAMAVLVLGATLMLVGAMLFLNFLSLRELIVETHLDPAIAVVFDTRDEMSHRRAQAVELLTGLAGAATVLGAAAWLSMSRRESRT